jgi:hypothetical protein
MTIIKNHPVCIIYYTLLCTVLFVQTVQYQLINFTVVYRVSTLDDNQRNFLQYIYDLLYCTLYCYVSRTLQKQ